jgi:hypothetical protein
MNNKTYRVSKHTPSVFQGRLNLAVASKPRMALSIEYPAERMIFRGLVAVLIVLAMCYLYFVSASVINIIAQKEAMSQTSRIEGSIGALEGQYFTLSQSITAQAAVAMGLTSISVKDIAYIDRPSVGIAEIAH